MKTTEKDNIIGRKFGRLTVIEKTNLRQSGHVLWECRCDCGNTVVVRKNSFVSKSTQSCGCMKKENRNDLTGLRFGRLTVIRETDERRNKAIVWECRCDCGNTTFVRGGCLQSGSTKSCGCFRKEILTKQQNKKNG